jgi:hypothetical protein
MAGEKEQGGEGQRGGESGRGLKACLEGQVLVDSRQWRRVSQSPAGSCGYKVWSASKDRPALRCGLSPFWRLDAKAT